MISENLETKRERPPYVTLSYCWGDTNAAACTTKENLADRMEGIELMTLPQTLQDAVLVTRSCNVRYLWIDAFCMWQVKSGINEDWTQQLPDMGMIYQNSLFTIAASSGTDSNSGLFDRAEVSFWPVGDYRFQGDGNSDPKKFLLSATLPD